MSYRVGPSCDGCGICRLACPRGAIQLTPDGPTPYMVVGLDCNDCGKCAIVCSPGALDLDPAWAVCWGRGCPLTTSRYEDWTCAEGRRRCTECGNSLWRESGGIGWLCIHCDVGSKVLCPKVRKSRASDPGPHSSGVRLVP